MHVKGSDFKRPVWFVTSEGSDITDDPSLTVSLEEGEFRDMIILVYGPFGRDQSKHFPLTKWPFDPTQEQALKRGDWYIRVDVSSDSTADIASAALKVSLERNDRSVWALYLLRRKHKLSYSDRPRIS
jgi:hypothetical protein